MSIHSRLVALLPRAPEAYAPLLRNLISAQFTDGTKAPAALAVREFIAMDSESDTAWHESLDECIADVLELAEDISAPGVF